MDASPSKKKVSQRSPFQARHLIGLAASQTADGTAGGIELLQLEAEGSTPWNKPQPQPVGWKKRLRRARVLAKKHGKPIGKWRF